VSQLRKKANNQAGLHAAYVAYAQQVDEQEITPQLDRLTAFTYHSRARGRQLETLLHLSHFSDHLVLISALSGAGKTTFIEQFLPATPTQTSIVHLALKKPVTASWVARALTQHLAVPVEQDAGLEGNVVSIQGLAQELAAQKEVLLIVVDNAHWLDEDALNLLANTLAGSEQLEARPHVILCADNTMVERIEAPAYAQLKQDRFYHLKLAPFSQEESADYLRQRLQHIGLTHGLAPIQLLQLHQLAKGNPGYLNMLANKALNKGGFVQQQGLPWLHIVATTLVVLILASIWLTNHYSDRSFKNVAAYASSFSSVLSDSNLEPTNIVTSQPAAAIINAPDPVAEPVQAIEGLVLYPLSTLPMPKPLPPLQPIELSPASKNISLEPKLEAKLAPATAQQIARLWPQFTAITNQPYHYQAILELPSDHFSLQILGARLEATLEAFVAKQKITQPHYAIQLVRGGQPWYMLLVGDYASASDAMNAVASLPVALQNQQPWPRPVSRIQQQIRNKFNTSGE